MPDTYRLASSYEWYPQVPLIRYTVGYAHSVHGNEETMGSQLCPCPSGVVRVAVLDSTRTSHDWHRMTTVDE